MIRKGHWKRCEKNPDSFVSKLYFFCFVFDLGPRTMWAEYAGGSSKVREAMLLSLVVAAAEASRAVSMLLVYLEGMSRQAAQKECKTSKRQTGELLFEQQNEDSGVRPVILSRLSFGRTTWSGAGRA